MTAHLPHSHTCFVCGESNAAGLKVRFLTDGEKVWTTVRVDERHMGYLGISHGGVLAALLDETMGWAPAVHTGRFCMAVELRIEYRRSVPIGEEVTVTGYVTDVSRRIWEGAGDIRGGDGTLYVRGSGRFIPMSEAATDEVMDMLLFGEDAITREQIVAARNRVVRARPASPAPWVGGDSERPAPPSSPAPWVGGGKGEGGPINADRITFAPDASDGVHPLPCPPPQGGGDGEPTARPISPAPWVGGDSERPAPPSSPAPWVGGGKGEGGQEGLPT